MTGFPSATGRLSAFAPASAAALAVAAVPYATVWMPFQTSLWASGAVVITIVASLAVVGRRGLAAAAAEAPGPVRTGLGLYLAAATYGAAVGVAHGNPIRYVATQTASMVILPAAFLAFRAGARTSVRRLAAGLGFGAFVAVAVHVALLAVRAGAPAVNGEALRLALPYDVAYTGPAVMALLSALAWAAETPSPLAAAACAASGLLLVGSMSRGAWLATAGGVGLYWWLSRRRRWWTLPLAASVALLCVAAVLGASARVWRNARPLLASRLDLPDDAPPGAVTDIGKRVPVTGGPVEIAFSVGGRPAGPLIVAVSSWSPGEGARALALLRPNPHDASTVVRTVAFPAAGATRLDFCVWNPPGTGQSLRLEARELPGALAGWVRTAGLRLGTLGAAVTDPASDATLGYRVREMEAVRDAWMRASLLRRLSGQGLGATVEFPNSSWSSSGRRITVPTASYLHNFYVFLGFKLGAVGIAALLGLLMVAGWTWRAAWRALPAGGSPALAAATACWCAYLAWSVTSPEIVNAHIATLLGALVAGALADAVPGGETPQAASRSQSSSTSSE